MQTYCRHCLCSAFLILWLRFLNIQFVNVPCTDWDFVPCTDCRHCLRSAHVLLSLESEMGPSDAWRVKGISSGDFYQHSWFGPRLETQPELCYSCCCYRWWPRCLYICWVNAELPSKLLCLISFDKHKTNICKLFEADNQSQNHQAQHFFGPPAVGFGVGLVSVYRLGL